jgi:hypothetical protein
VTVRLRRPSFQRNAGTFSTAAAMVLAGSPIASASPWSLPDRVGGLKCLYLVTRSLALTGAGRTRWTMRWKAAINAFAITFGDRFRHRNPLTNRRKHR